jgi:2-polyprenyl-6-methoxyphenol hydroxylase-like FAD-dependent oxidoreductase
VLKPESQVYRSRIGWHARGRQSPSSSDHLPFVWAVKRSISAEVHLNILRQMGIFDRLVAEQTRMAPICFLGEQGLPAATLSEEFAGGEIEVLRGTLVRALADTAGQNVRYRFNESIRELNESSSGIQDTFESRDGEEYDIIAGADGSTRMSAVWHLARRNLTYGITDTGTRLKRVQTECF